MNTSIGVVRGTTIKKVLEKNFNIYMGISLNNKWFTKENIEQYILWGLKYTKERFGIVIADTLQAINYQISSKYTRQAAIRKSLKEGDKFAEMINEILIKLPEEKRNSIDIIRWDEVKKDKTYKKTLTVFQEEYEKNTQFKKEITDIVKGFTQRLDKKATSQDKIEKLTAYILEEFPELINGFTFNKLYYSCWIYPNDATLLRLVEKIQNKEKFPELHDKTEIKRNRFVELKVE